MLTLVGRSTRRMIRLFAAILAILLAFQILIVVVAANFVANRGDFRRLAELVPSFMQHVVGFALMSFSGMTTIAYFEPLIVMLVAQFAIYLASEPAGDVEFGIVDLVLARPLPRHWLISRSLFLMAASTLALIVSLAAGLWIGLLLFAPPNERWPDASTVVTLTAYLTAVSWCFGAAALAVTGWARRRASAFAPVAIGCVALYLLELVGSAWEPVRPLAQLSPFHYFQGSAVLQGTASPVRDLSLFATLTIAMTTVAYWRFARRDL